MPECSGAPKQSRPANAISRLMIASCAKLPPAPPYCSGIDAHNSPASPDFLHMARSMMPASFHCSRCGTNSAAKNRRACSSSRTRSSVIQAGRGRLRTSMKLRLVAIRMMIIEELRCLLRLQPFIRAFCRQRKEHIKPGHLALNPVLIGWAHGLRVIEAAYRNADVAALDDPVRQRRAASRAKAALGETRTLEHGRLPARKAQMPALAAGKGHERLPRRLLAHTAVAHARVFRRLGPFIAHRPALAASS